MSETAVFFEQRYYVRLVLDKHQGPIAIPTGGPHSVDVHIRPLQPEEQNKDLGDAVSCIASGTWAPKQSTVEWIRNYSQGLMPDGKDPEIAWKQFVEDLMKEPFTPGVARMRTMMELFPESLRSTLTSIRAELEGAALTVVGLTRWRMDSRGGHDAVLQDRGFHVSFDRTTWWRLPSESEAMDVSSETHARIEPSIQAELTEYVAKDLSQPLAHELLREAFSTRTKNPRSSLIVAVTALEVGVKDYIARLVPNVKWLAFEAPSPPVVNILNDYLPTLPSRAPSGQIKKPPARLIDTLKKGVKLRNSVIHQGKGNISLLTLREILDAVADVLRVLDYHQGFVWALQYVRAETRKEWEGT